MSELEQLKDILLAEERSARDEQHAQLAAQIQANFDALPDALPDLIKKAQHDDRLVRALEKPLSLGMERMARTQKALLVSILFPLIGPIIRRSISETLSTLIRDMNRAVEHSISPTGLRWRFEAFRTGVPFAQVVLKHTLRYRIEHLLLVNNNGGLLIAHVANDNAMLADSDAVAAMLSALQDFARDAILARADESLSSVEVGGMTLRILRGPLMHLAVAVRGEMTESAQNRLEELLESLHLNVEVESDIDVHKEELLENTRDWLLKNGQESSEAQDDIRSESEAQPTPIWVILLGLLVTALLCAWLITHVWHNQQAAKLQRAFAEKAGYSVQVVFDDGRYRLLGARDPEADSIASVADALQIDPRWIDGQMLAPQLSLAPELWKRRLEKTGHLPKSVRLRADAHAVRLSGELSSAQLRQVRSVLEPWQTLVAVDYRELRIADKALIEKRLAMIRQLALMSVRKNPLEARSTDLALLKKALRDLLATAPEQSLALHVVVSAGAQALLNELQAELPALRIESVEGAVDSEMLLGITHLELLSLSGKAR
jgi:hypothetical protein